MSGLSEFAAAHAASSALARFNAAARALVAAQKAYEAAQLEMRNAMQALADEACKESAAP